MQMKTRMTMYVTYPVRTANIFSFMRQREHMIARYLCMQLRQMCRCRSLMSTSKLIRSEKPLKRRIVVSSSSDTD